VDNAIVEIDNLELPIVDAAPCLREADPSSWLASAAGRRAYVKILKPLELAEGTKKIAVYLLTLLRELFNCLPPPVIGRNRWILPHAGSYEHDVAPARTFGFLAEVEMLLKSGLSRRLAENVVVLDQKRVMNPEGSASRTNSAAQDTDLIGDISCLDIP